MKLLYLLVMLTLAACSPALDDSARDNDAMIPSAETATAENNTDVASDFHGVFEKANVLQLFFKEDHSVATFAGEGNEYASFTEKTTWLDEENVQIIIDNGGVTLYRLYHIDEDAIYLMYENPTPPTKEPTSYPIVEEVMRLPMEVGTAVGEWNITATDATIETPYGTFNEAIELTLETPNTVSRRYYAKAYGLVMQTDDMQTGDGVYTVSSSLDTLTFE